MQTRRSFHVSRRRARPMPAVNERGFTHGRRLWVDRLISESGSRCSRPAIKLRKVIRQKCNLCPKPRNRVAAAGVVGVSGVKYSICHALDTCTTRGTLNDNSWTANGLRRILRLSDANPRQIYTRAVQLWTPMERSSDWLLPICLAVVFVWPPYLAPQNTYRLLRQGKAPHRPTLYPACHAPV
ncbi:hypothetical protein K440DRAFT_2780 [Wilcoxina mikolae CBS 423.85]|nr:hypothetical protein K440DRAFT_2780 [Wilcoxina mikolae CBS 423.85]